MLTIVTGSNTVYFNYLKRLIKNVKDVLNKDNIKANIVVYDLGLEEEEKMELVTITDIIIEIFDYSKYPPHVDLKTHYGKNCSYAWKPIIIHEVCEKYGNNVLWMDTKNLYNNFTNIRNTLNNHSIYSPTSAANVRKWTHKKTMDYMDAHKYRQKANRNAAIIGVNYNTSWVKEFVGKWKDLSLIKECIVPEGSNRDNHRQDQSVMTILYYQFLDIHKFKKIDIYLGGISCHNKM